MSPKHVFLKGQIDDKPLFGPMITYLTGAQYIK